MPAQKAPLHTLSTEEYQELQRIVKAGSERLDRVRRAQALPAVAEGHPYTGAARQMLPVKVGSRVGIAWHSW